MKKLYDKIKKLVSHYGIIFFLIAAVIVSYYYGIERIFNVDFVCTNGDYQNYNILRRFLDGQIPYKDFANYLGMGVLYMCTPFLKIHNTFAGNLFVTNMVASFAFIIFVTVIFYLITGNKKVSCLAGLLFPKLLSSKILEKFIPVYGYYTKTYLELLAYPKNSFRIVRMFLAVLICIVALIVIPKIKTDESDSKLRNITATKKGAGIIGFIVGLGITWSNDFGFCCIGSTFLVMLILTIVDIYQKRECDLYWKRFIFFCIGLISGAIISILIASRGNISSWLEFTFGVGDWQYTYFGRMFDDKYSASLITLFTLKQLKRTRLHLVIYFVSMMYCLYKLCISKANDRMVLYVFMFTSIVSSHVFYILGSGGDGFTEGTYGFVIISFWAILSRYVIKLIEKFRFKKLLDMAVISLAVIYTGFMVYSDFSLIKQYNSSNIKADANYVEELEGITIYADALKEMNELVGNNTLFSTYATALEDIRDDYQPTGNDYVIHALGDKRYSDYVDNFISKKYDWVQTTNYEVWPWEIWTSKASWELYKEIYSNYVLNSKHSYWAMWKYVGENHNVVDADVKLDIDQINCGTVIISVESDEKRPCYVDIEMDWATTKTDSLDALLSLRKLVYVEDVDSAFTENESGAGYFLKSEGVKNLPIYMEEGKGSIILKVVPENALSLKLNNVDVCEVILKQT